MYCFVPAENDPFALLFQINNNKSQIVDNKCILDSRIFSILRTQLSSSSRLKFEQYAELTLYQVSYRNLVASKL